MHYKPSDTPSDFQSEHRTAAQAQPNHRSLKHAVYAAGVSAALSVLIMTGCSCSANQDAQEMIPNTGAPAANTAVQANSESQAANQGDAQDVAQYSTTAPSGSSNSATESAPAETDERIKAAEQAQKEAEEAEAQLQEQLEAAQKAQADAESATKAALEEKEALQKEVDNAQSAQTTAEADAQALLEEREAMLADLDTLTAEKDALAADKEKLETDLQSAQAAQAKAEEETAAAKEAQTKAEGDLSKANEELASTSAQLQKAQEAIQAVEESAKADADELTAAQEAQKKAEADLAQAQKELDSAIADKDAAKAEVDQAKQENASLAEANATAEEARANAEAEAEAAKAAQAEAEAKVEAGLQAAEDVAAAQAAQAKAETEAQEAKDAQAKAENEAQKLQEENAALQAKLDAVSAESGTEPEAPETPADAPDGSTISSPEGGAGDSFLATDTEGTLGTQRPNRFGADNYFAYGMAVRPSLEAYSWTEIAHIASFIEARAMNREEAIEYAKTFNLVNPDGSFTGNTKAVTLTDGQTVNVLLVDIFHDYTELDEPTAFTFMLAESYAQEAMNVSGTNEGGWEESDMRYWLNSAVIEKLPDSLYYSIKPVQKFTNNIGATDSSESVTGTTDLLFPFSWVECLGPIAWNEGSDLSFIDDVLNAEGYQYAWFTQQGVAGDQNNPALIRSDRNALSTNASLEDETVEAENASETEEIIHGENGPIDTSESTWWMRSADPSNGTNYGDMGPEIENGSVASTPEGVVFGFCL